MTNVTENEVLRLLTAQKEEMEKQTAAYNKAAKEYAVKAVECARAKQAALELKKVNEDKQKLEQQHIIAHERLCALTEELIDVVKSLIDSDKISEVLESHTDAVNKVALVLGILLGALQNEIRQDAKSQVESLMKAIQAGMEKSHHINIAQTQSDIKANGDITAGRDITSGD